MRVAEKALRKSLLLVHGQGGLIDFVGLAKPVAVMCRTPEISCHQYGEL